VAASPRLRLSVPSDASRLSPVRREVLLFLRLHAVDPEPIDDVVMCVHEACANAVHHSQSHRDIEVELVLDAQSVKVAVSDRGCGLDLDQCDPLREPELLRLRGRGLYLMAKLMDEFEISIDGGTEIRMLKRLADGGGREGTSAANRASSRKLGGDVTRWDPTGCPTPCLDE
jgi:anti-sigma regulatory factor (Ser/Thr protein kinase)